MVTIIKLFPKLCSCGTLLGSRQYAFEKAVEDKLKTTDLSVPNMIQKVQAQVATDFGWIKMCCRNSTFNCATYFIRDSNRGAFRDEVGLLAGVDNYDIRKAVIRDGPLVEYKVHPPSFPPLPGIETPSMSPKRSMPLPNSIGNQARNQGAPQVILASLGPKLISAPFQIPTTKHITPKKSKIQTKQTSSRLPLPS